MTEETGSKRRLTLFAIAAIVAGFATAILVGQFWSSGAAEIAGVMLCSLVFCIGAFWDFHVRPWFMPIIGGWVAVHLAIFFFIVVPRNVQDSRALIQLIWVEFFGFAGLLWVASRLWGGLPD